MGKAKRIRGLNCTEPAAQAIRLVFVTRFNELLEWRKSALDWSDPEGVHSMRVASRRLRSAMRDFSPYLPKRSFTSVSKELKSLADTLGEVRDQDVAIQALEEIEKKAPAQHSAALKQLIDTRKKFREQQRKKLKAVLAKGTLKKLESAFAAAVAEAVAAAARKSKRSTPSSFRDVAQNIIRDRLKEFEKRSDGLFRPLDVNALHELRIATKRLRYAIELLAPCIDSSIAAHAKHAARLQTTLGDLHDCDTWILNLGDEILPARKEATEKVAALVWLLNHYTRLRTKHLQHAFSRWRDWEARDVNEKLRASVTHEKPAKQNKQLESQSLDQVVSEPQNQGVAEERGSDRPGAGAASLVTVRQRF